MKNTERKYLIKIPRNIIMIFDKKNRIVSAVGSLTVKSLKIDLNIKISLNKDLVEIKNIGGCNVSNSKKKKIISLQKTFSTHIKQLLLETTCILYKKLQLVGVGYKVFDSLNFRGKLLTLRLGYSHPIHFKIPNNSSVFCHKKTKLFFYGNSYLIITQMASFLRSYKKPESYKGKGALYENEKVLLKEGKKV